MENSKMEVWSEIEDLKTVILHRPGAELDNLIPRYLEDLLFDEIPWLSKAQEEHDGFAQTLVENNTKIYYITDLLYHVIQDYELKNQLIKEHLQHAILVDPNLVVEVHEYLLSLPENELIYKLMAGLPKREVQQLKKYRTLSDLTVSSYPFYLDPMPSMYFTRDHGAMIGNKLLISSMFNPARKRETIFLKFIQKYHPLFTNTPTWFYEEIPKAIEGGDILVINTETLIIGLSERTTEEAIEWVAHRFLVEENLVKQIIVIEIPAKRAYMHLDTVFTMVDYDKFLMYPEIKNSIDIYWLEKGKDNRVSAHNGYSLEEALKKALKLKNINIIYSGGNEPITAAREQWSDSTNTLAVKPGVVICYDRNEATNRTLRNNGITVLEIEGSELVRGRGGPRCMSMPLSRSAI
ncbi:MAG: arginine deiminase [Bacillota bacterium]